MEKKRNILYIECLILVIISDWIIMVLIQVDFGVSPQFHKSRVRGKFHLDTAF